MPDGLDQTADLFRQEISPSSERARDDGGRFTGGRPEPLFEERPVEGDERTGDTRDAGDDERLKAIERRVADGRAEEGDADELAKGARTTPGDPKHRRANAEQAGDGEQKPDGEDAKDDDKDLGDDGADEGAEDAEAARWSLTHDGKPVEKIEVDVGGETKQVSLQEVVKGYAEQEAINQRARQVQEYAQAFEQQSAQVAQEIGQARQTYQQRLAYIGRVMADLYPKELNWEQEYSADPGRAHQKEEVFKHVRGRMESIAHEMQREQAEAQAQYQAQQQYEAQRMASYIEDGKREFQRKTGITDQPTLNNEYAAMRKAAMEIYGFLEHEVGSIFDPRMMLVLQHASKYLRLTADKPRPVMPDHGRTLAPGSARPNSGSAARRRIDDALKTQARTGGSIDATAAVFERLLR